MDYSDLISAIEGVIKANGNGDITGPVMQQALVSIINSLGEHATFAGVATPGTNPGTPDGNVFYLASEAGVYANFSGSSVLEDEMVVLSNKSGVWLKSRVFDFATIKEAVVATDNKIGLQGILLDRFFTSYSDNDATIWKDSFDGNLVTIINGVLVVSTLIDSNVAIIQTINDIENTYAEDSYLIGVNIFIPNSWGGEFVQISVVVYDQFNNLTVINHEVSELVKNEWNRISVKGKFSDAGAAADVAKLRIDFRLYEEGVKIKEPIMLTSSNADIILRKDGEIEELSANVNTLENQLNQSNDAVALLNAARDRKFTSYSDSSPENIWRDREDGNIVTIDNAVLTLDTLNAPQSEIYQFINDTAILTEMDGYCYIIKVFIPTGVGSPGFRFDMVVYDDAGGFEVINHEVTNFVTNAWNTVIVRGALGDTGFVGDIDKIRFSNYLYANGYKIKEPTMLLGKNAELFNSIVESIPQIGFDKAKYQLAFLENNRLKCNDSSPTRTAKYTGLDIGADVSLASLRCKVIFEPGGDGASVALITNPNGLRHVDGITAKSLHIVFTPTKVNIGFFDNETLVVAYEYTYSSPLSMDGTTEYELGFNIVRNPDRIYLITPDGSHNWPVVGYTLDDYLGRFITWEHFYTGLGIARPEFTKFIYVDSDGFTFNDDFVRENGAIGNNPYGIPYVQLTNSVTL